MAESSELATTEGWAHITDIVTLWKAQYASHVMHEVIKDGKSPRKRFGGFHRHGPQTWHERVWAAWHPDLQRQVDFGTGKLGAQKYLASSFTVDFWDEPNKVVYEVDGATHSHPLQRTADLNKQRFLEDRGLKLIRISNASIEATVTDALFWALASQFMARFTPGRISWFETDLSDPLRAVMLLQVEACYGTPQFNAALSSVWADIEVTPPGTRVALHPLADGVPAVHVLQTEPRRPGQESPSGRSLWIKLTSSKAGSANT